MIYSVSAASSTGTLFLFFLSSLAQAMGEDIVPEKIKEEIHAEVKCVGPEALAASVVASSKEFEDKWFRKIKDHSRPLENQLHMERQLMA